jgi:hypothetical protein
MGCYGVGVTRTLQAVIEQSHDKDGIVWPASISPYQVVIDLLDPDDAEVVKVADELESQLEAMGIDVIVGGHPHVVQPIDLLESTTDPSHKTVCIYSTGNAISNQRQGAIDAIKTAHTEDGILFSITFEKQDDGDAYIVGVDALPTWANMFTNANKRREYNIIPLDIDEIDSWKENFDLSNESYKKAQASYERTMAIIGEGLSEVQQYADSNTAKGKESVLLSMARRAKGQK